MERKVTLIHTLLFMLRENRLTDDLAMAKDCLKSLEKSTYHTVVVYNQGFFTGDRLKEFLSDFRLDVHIIGEGINAGTAAGRQRCFEYVWERFPECGYISELHLDMTFPEHWEDALVDYLGSHDEPMVSCGIIDKQGNMPFLNKTAMLPQSREEYDIFLQSLRENEILHGFTNPCIHVSAILKETGGYNPLFLKGGQCFEDDSMLLGYYYYYGTKRNWYPKINFNSVVYHAVAGQRLNMGGNVMVNFGGLVKQYGLMGLKHLCVLHKSAWHKSFFAEQYDKLLRG
jgi:hypothetical protein